VRFFLRTLEIFIARKSHFSRKTGSANNNGALLSANIVVDKGIKKMPSFHKKNQVAQKKGTFFERISRELSSRIPSRRALLMLSLHIGVFLSGVRGLERGLDLNSPSGFDSAVGHVRLLASLWQVGRVVSGVNSVAQWFQVKYHEVVAKLEKARRVLRKLVAALVAKMAEISRFATNVAEAVVREKEEIESNIQVAKEEFQALSRTREEYENIMQFLSFLAGIDNYGGGFANSMEIPADQLRELEYTLWVEEQAAQEQPVEELQDDRNDGQRDDGADNNRSGADDESQIESYGGNDSMAAQLGAELRALDYRLTKVFPKFLSAVARKTGHVGVNELFLQPAFQKMKATVQQGARTVQHRAESIHGCVGGACRSVVQGAQEVTRKLKEGLRNLPGLFRDSLIVNREQQVESSQSESDDIEGLRVINKDSKVDLDEQSSESDDIDGLIQDESSSSEHSK
jgi:hypothetical protein